MPKTKFQDVVKNWQTTDEHVGDAIHKHFTEIEPTFEDWIDVYTEGMSIWSLALGEELDEFDIETDILAGVAASAWNLALERVVKALDLPDAGGIEELLDGMRDDVLARED
jgi:hypothetical protein